MKAQMMTEGEKGREALAMKMHDAVIRELNLENGGRTEDEVFKGMDQHTVLGAIADLTALLIVRADLADGGYDVCDFGSMVGYVSKDLREWAAET